MNEVKACRHIVKVGGSACEPVAPGTRSGHNLVTGARRIVEVSSLFAGCCLNYACTKMNGRLPNSVPQLLTRSPVLLKFAVKSP